MLRDRLKELDLKITELADYLQLSRPTMYKFIECYDNKEFSSINKNVLKLFNYINENELVGKKNVVNYILNNLVKVDDMNEADELEVVKNVRNLLMSNPESKKGQFITYCMTTDSFDSIMTYMTRIAPILKKKRLTKEEKTIISPYINFTKEINYKGETE